MTISESDGRHFREWLLKWFIFAKLTLGYL